MTTDQFHCRWCSNANRMKYTTRLMAAQTLVFAWDSGLHLRSPQRIQWVLVNGWLDNTTVTPSHRGGLAPDLMYVTCTPNNDSCGRGLGMRLGFSGWLTLGRWGSLPVLCYIIFGTYLEYRLLSGQLACMYCVHKYTIIVPIQMASEV